MTDNQNQPEVTDEAIVAVLEGMRNTFKAQQEASPEYQAMLASEHVGQVVRKLHSKMLTPALDAADILQDKFGLQKTSELYHYLLQLPYRWKIYEAAFNAETHVGCVDRTVNLISRELAEAAAGRTPSQGGHRQAAAVTLVTGDDQGTASNILIVAVQIDESRRIQRLSCNTPEISRRLAEKTFADVPEETLKKIVRSVLWTAAEIVHEQDGLETE